MSLMNAALIAAAEERDKLKDENQRLRMASADAEAGWKRCSAACARMQTERDAALLKLQEALDARNERSAQFVAACQENLMLSSRLDALTKQYHEDVQAQTLRGDAHLNASKELERRLNTAESRLDSTSNRLSLAMKLLDEVGAGSNKFHLDRINRFLAAARAAIGLCSKSSECLGNDGHDGGCWTITEDSCRREAAPTPAPLLDGLLPQGEPSNPSASEDGAVRESSHQQALKAFGGPNGSVSASVVERQEKN